MARLVSAIFSYLLGFLRSRHDLGVEILALRQRLAVFKRQHPRPGLKRRDCWFWVALYSLWDRWTDALIIVKPETVVRWASRRVPPLLALPLARLLAGPAKDRAQRLRTGQAHGKGESFLGRAENPWRTCETRR